MRPVVPWGSAVNESADHVLQPADPLVEGGAGQPFVVLATARRSIEGRWHPPHGGRHNLVVLTLDPLTPDSARSLLRELAGVDVAPELAAVLLERSGGNPFFLEELVTLLSEAGVVGADAPPATAAAGSVPGLAPGPGPIGLPTPDRQSGREG